MNPQGFRRRRGGRQRAWLLLLLVWVHLLASCGGRKPLGVDEAWLRTFSERLADKVRIADVVFVGRRVMSLGAEGRVSLYRIQEVLKGEELVRRVMAPYPEVEGSVMVAYEAPREGKGHAEPEGITLLFLTAPPNPGKNLHLLGEQVDHGMIYAEPAVVERARDLCRR